MKYLAKGIITVAALLMCSGLVFIAYQLIIFGWRALIFVGLGVIALVTLVQAMKYTDKEKPLI